MCKRKRENGIIKYKFLLLHSLIHAVIAYLLIARWNNFMIPFIIFATHLPMDYIKSTYMKEDLRSFIIDQSVHIIILTALWLGLSDEINYFNSILTKLSDEANIWVIVLAYMIILKPISILLNLFIKRRVPESFQHDARHTLPKAGLWIGYLERIMILTFIFTDNKESIGFLLAAKSIFRFGELKKPQEIKLTEYVLIGTLASFVSAILIGFIATKIMDF